MSTLTIRKKSLKTWLHTDSILGNFIISKFYFNADNVSFQIVEQGQSKRVIYNITDITLYALPTGGTAETFGNITELSLRLEELNYPAFQYDGQITSIANLIDAGTGVTITGDGTAESPYVINSSITQTPDATTSVKGKLKLAGDLSGTADLPTVPALAGKQATLVSGTNIKTVNGNSLLGSGDIVTGGGGSQTLAEVLVEGNITDGENISISNGDAIVLDNGANLKKGTTDAGLGGSKGIALRCAVDYELKWEAGRLYVMGGDGFTIREVSHNFTTLPTLNDDDTKGFVIDSRWILDNGDVYVCIDDTTGAAAWELVNTGTTPTLQEVLDNNHDLLNGNNFQGSAAGDGNTGIFVNALGQDAANTNSGTQVNALGTEAAYQNEGGDINAFGNGSATLNTGNNVNVFGNNAGGSNSGNNVNAIGFLAGQLNTANNLNAFGYNAGNSNTFSNVNLFGENANADEDGQIVFAKDGTTMARISTAELTSTQKYNLPDASGTLALTDDITTPTLQQVTDNGNNETTNDVIVKDSENKLSLRPRSILFQDIDEGGTTNLSFQQTSVLNQEIEIRGLGGTMALLSDIPTGGGGIPHATASGTDTYTATITGVAAYTDADAYLIRFTNGNTTGATLNINALGAKTLYRNNDGVLIGGDIISGGEMLCIYNTSLNGFQVIGTAPNSLFAYVTNADSVTITKGMPVYAFGGTGDRMTVKRAFNTGDATSAQTVGLVLSTSIAANQKGLIMMQGLLDGLSILPTSTWSDGDAVYLGATAGTITNVKPFAPNHLVYLGVVTTASNGSAGRMYVRVQNGYELQELHNVQAQSPSLNDILRYDNSVTPAQWKTASISTVLGFTPENVANKENTTLDTSTTKYPTNRLTKEYTDAKVADSITNGVTTIAPSQNAVFDALALKQAVLSYTPYRNIQTSQTVHTGTTVETVLFTATIPAGAFSSTDIIKVLFGVNKLNVAGTYSLRLRINTTNTISGAPTIALYNGTNTAQVNVMMRNFNLNGGNLYGFMFTTSGMTDITAQGGSLGSTTLNPANQFFIFATVTLNNSLDNFIGNMLSISN